MTTVAFIIICLTLLVAILNGLPIAGALPSGMADSVVLIVGYMKAWNFFFPINEIFVCVGIVLIYEFLTWAMHALFRMYRAVRGNMN